MAESEEKPKTEAKASGTGGSKLIPILLLVNSLLSASVLGLFVVKLGAKHDPPSEEHAAASEAHGKDEKEPKAEKGKEGKEQPGPTMRLADFVVHLRDAENERYARISFETELSDEKAKDVVTAHMPQIRDAFISYLSDRSADELRGSEQINQMKGVLAQKLAAIVPGPYVRALYVTELVVQ
ncbi:MAG TPA: flagellar basal body-associated FliL family protein [Anaeromyxobacteraceae bacterium]|nr:flagellar basal body-associated FliL family protein [Anaeromyxobacteraceae bacterium]